MEEQKEPCFVLLVDSDEEDFVLAKDMLNASFGNRVALEWHPTDGAVHTKICSGRYGFSMIEYRIGTENGLEVIEKVKAQCSDQVVFLFSDWPDPGLEERAMQAGATGFFNKNAMSVSAMQALFGPYLCHTGNSHG